MLRSQVWSGFVRLGRKVYAFGCGDIMYSSESEIYDICADWWVLGPQMPVTITNAHAIYHINKIFITGTSISSVVEFEPIKETYRVFELQLTSLSPKSLLVTSSQVIVLSNLDNCGMKIDKQGHIIEEFWLTREWTGGMLYGPVIYNGRTYFIDSFKPYFREFDTESKRIKYHVEMPSHN